MIYIGMDVSSKSFVVHAINERKRKIFSGEISPTRTSLMKTYESRPLRDFFNRIERRRGKKRALVALARKILTTVYGVMKSGEFYNPQALLAYTD